MPIVKCVCSENAINIGLSENCERANDIKLGLFLIGRFYSKFVVGFWPNVGTHKFGPEPDF